VKKWAGGKKGRWRQPSCFIAARRCGGRSTRQRHAAGEGREREGERGWGVSRLTDLWHPAGSGLRPAGVDGVVWQCHVIDLNKGGRWDAGVTDRRDRGKAGSSGQRSGCEKERERGKAAVGHRHEGPSVTVTSGAVQT
jgi:hypothetical protein